MENYFNKMNSENIEIYTPKSAIDMIVPYLKKEWLIWAPFSKQEHNFVSYLRDKGFNVISSHIEEGKDFLKYQPEKWDIILDNPPFKGKSAWIKRAIELKTPFAFLLPLHTLNDLGVPKMFIEKNLEMEILVPDRRIQFLDQVKKGISFKTIYICHKVLPEKLILTEYKERRK